jgi:DNA-binding NarL/FixJ family response regulator
MEAVLAPVAVPVARSVPREDGPKASVPAILVGTDGDRRLLLRGVLLLAHHPVTFEARTAEELGELAPATGSELLVLDTDAEEGSWPEQLATVLAGRPSMRAIVLLPAGAESGRSAAERAGARVTLHRPFTLRAFREALGDALATDGPGVAA